MCFRLFKNDIIILNIYTLVMLNYIEAITKHLNTKSSVFRSIVNILGCICDKIRGILLFWSRNPVSLNSACAILSQILFNDILTDLFMKSAHELMDCPAHLRWDVPVQFSDILRIRHSFMVKTELFCFVYVLRKCNSGILRKVFFGRPETNIIWKVCALMYLLPHSRHWYGAAFRNTFFEGQINISLCPLSIYERNWRIGDGHKSLFNLRPWQI